MTIYNITTEILIIGGGITGASTAYFLTQAGHEVILLERNELACEASGLNAGTLWQIGWALLLISQIRSAWEVCKYS